MASSRGSSSPAWRAARARKQAIAPMKAEGEAPCPLPALADQKAARACPVGAGGLHPDRRLHPRAGSAPWQARLTSIGTTTLRFSSDKVLTARMLLPRVPSRPCLRQPGRGPAKPHLPHRSLSSPAIRGPSPLSRTRTRTTKAPWTVVMPPAPLSVPGPDDRPGRTWQLAGAASGSEGP